METSQVIIRPARPEEGEALAVIEATCFPPAEAASREAVLERLATFPENFLVAETDGKAIGFINGANRYTVSSGCHVSRHHAAQAKRRLSDRLWSERSAGLPKTRHCRKACTGLH